MANALVNKGGLAAFDVYLLSTVTVHMWERGGMCLVTATYESLVYSTIYPPHELKGLIITSTSHTATEL